MNTEINLELPKIGHEMLAKLRSGKMNVSEFDNECAYWIFKGIQDLHHKPSPTMPEDMREYQARKRNDRRFQIGDAFWQQPHIRAYSASDSAIRSLNAGSIHWLHFLKSNIPTGDVQAHIKIAAALHSHGEDKYIVKTRFDYATV